MRSRALAAPARRATTPGSRSSARDTAQAFLSARWSTKLSNNIFVIPNDTIYLYSEPQTFVAFGAAGTQGHYRFDAWRAFAGRGRRKAWRPERSLKPIRATSSSIAAKRAQVAERLGVDVSKYKGPIIPIIYHVNFRDPSGYFQAQTFEMRNKDVIYTSNAISVETTKFLNYLRTIMATANDPIIYATNVYALKAARGVSRRRPSSRRRRRSTANSGHDLQPFARAALVPSRRLRACKTEAFSGMLPRNRWW